MGVCMCVHVHTCKCVFTETVLCANSLSCVHLFVILWTVACQGPLSMGFSRQGYWSGLPCPSLGDLPDPGIEPTSLMSPALASGFLTTSATRCTHWFFYCFSLLWTIWVPLLTFCFLLFFCQLVFCIYAKFLTALMPRSWWVLLLIKDDCFINHSKIKADFWYLLDCLSL